jgi:ribosomal protein S8
MLVEQGLVLGYSQSQDNSYYIVVYIKVNGPRIALLYTPNKKINVSVYQLKSLHYRDFPNFYMVMTSHGFLLHTEALRRKIGGFLFCKIMYI